MARASFSSIENQLIIAQERSKVVSDDILENHKLLGKVVATLDSALQQPLSDLRTNISATKLQEYESTRETPQKRQYEYPKDLPCTKSCIDIVATGAIILQIETAVFSSLVYSANDKIVTIYPLTASFSSSVAASGITLSLPRLREVPVNISDNLHNSMSVSVANPSEYVCADNKLPRLRRGMRTRLTGHLSENKMW